MKLCELYYEITKCTAQHQSLVDFHDFPAERDVMRDCDETIPTVNGSSGLSDGAV